MANAKQLRKQRNRFWETDPTCYWCGIETVLPENITDKSQPMATIDHLRHRGNPKRLEPGDGHTLRHVLACAKCNRRRGGAKWKKLSQKAPE